MIWFVVICAYSSEKWLKTNIPIGWLKADLYWPVPYQPTRLLDPSVMSGDQLDKYWRFISVIYGGQILYIFLIWGLILFLVMYPSIIFPGVQLTMFLIPVAPQCFFYNYFSSS